MASVRLENWRQKLTKCTQAMNTEPVILLFNIQLGVFVSSFPAFLFYKICANLYGHEQTNIGDYCKSLTDNVTLKAFKENVEVGVSSFSRYIFICGSLPMIFVCLIMGSIMDTHGRKGPLVFSLMANIVTNVMLLAFAIEIRSSHLWLLLCFLFTGLTGQITVTMVACFTSITDVTRKSNQTTRLGIGAAVTTSGTVIGCLFEGWLVTAFGFTYVMVSMLVLLIVTTLYAIIFVKETVHLAKKPRGERDMDDARSDYTDVWETESGVSGVSGVSTTSTVPRQTVNTTALIPAPPPPLWAHKGRNFMRQKFTPHRLLETLKTVIRPREGYDRAYLISLLIAMFLLCLSEVGPPLYLYLKNAPLFWRAGDYAYYVAYVSALSAFGSGGTSWLFSKVFKTSDLLMVVIGLFFAIVQKIVFCASEHTWTVFVAGLAVLIASISAPGFRSVIATLVEKHETGKVFSVIGLIDNIAPLISVVIFNSLYDATHDWRPRSVFILSACFVLSGLAVVLGVYLHVKCRDYASMDEHERLIASYHRSYKTGRDDDEGKESTVDILRNL